MAERARSTAERAKPKAATPPTLRREKDLARQGARWVIGCDEVGRGAIAGPVAVGLCVVDLSKRTPRGLRDSKLLPEPRRVALEPVVRRWAVSSSVGMASNAEIDEFGLSAALGLAGARALAALLEDGFPCSEDAVVLLDGNWDYLTPGMRAAGISERPRVTTRIKADLTCASVSGASVLAKVARDSLMIGLHDDHPPYGWVSNKGYGSRTHWAAIDEHGATDFHRHTWLRTPSLFDLEDEAEAVGAMEDAEFGDLDGGEGVEDLDDGEGFDGGEDEADLGDPDELPDFVEQLDPSDPRLAATPSAPAS
ncbi:ribonuclease HII [Naasia sp. SYSU D00948]|uniref:ribonuclease HII n=1 Tax=Naasia sp. SYSU D00948 TaxID=2817379 RepID=UPI001B30EF66|nr:ribonuclease HII [Naasia sp. SYSU D00948]